MKNTISNQKTLLIISILSILSGALCTLANDVLLFLPIAFLSSLFYFDKSDKKMYSIVVSAILFAINGVGIAIGITYCLFAPASVIIALLMSYAFANKESKSDTAFLMTVICSVFTFLSYILLAMILKNDYSFDAAIAFYNDVISKLKDIFVNGMLEVYTQAGFEITADLLGQLFDSQLNMIFSYIFIAGFLIVGLSFKLFGFILKKCLDDKTEILSWRFKTSSLFAYFYLILVFLSMFLVSSTDILSVVVFNLYNIFLVIYAYVGFNVIKDMLGNRLRPIFAIFLLLLALMVFSSLAVQILAVYGVLYTIRTNRGVAENN